IVVASVNDRRPERAFSNVEMLILAISARYWREMRRRASSSRTTAATQRLCSSESWFSESWIPELAGIISPVGTSVSAHHVRSRRTIPHLLAQRSLRQGAPWRAVAEQSQ